MLARQVALYMTNVLDTNERSWVYVIVIWVVDVCSAQGVMSSRRNAVIRCY